MFSFLSYLLPLTPYPYLGQALACDLCGESDSELVCRIDRRLKKLTTVACIRCGLMRTEPMPTAAEIARYYCQFYRFDYGLSLAGPSRRHLNRSRREARKRLARLEPMLPAGGQILDFGAGAGVFLAEAKARGFVVKGVEPGAAFARYARTRFAVEVIDDVWENLAPIGRFDLITAVEVLEHLRQPVEALRWLAAMLAPDGIIYVTVPNMLPNGKEPFRRFHFAHLHHFTPTTLRWAAGAAGLEPDPRFDLPGTTMVFRKARNGRAPVLPEGAHGRGLGALYPDVPIGRYLLRGGWLARIPGRLRKTVRDTIG